jgi:hypothetical protein
MNSRWLLLFALLAAWKTAAAQDKGSDSGADDQKWGICRAEDDPNECAAHARGIAKGDLGHAESLRGYARVCLDVIANAIQEKSVKVAAAQAALDKHQQAKSSAGLPPPPAQDALEAKNAADQIQAELEDAQDELDQMKQHKKEAEGVFNGPLGKKLDEVTYLKLKLDRTFFESGSDGEDSEAASKFNAGVREMIEDLEKNDKAMDKDLRRIIGSQKAADPKSDCDPALKDPYY